MGDVGVAMSGTATPVPASELSVRLQKRFVDVSKSDSPFQLDVQFAASAGFTILFGASGSGKTTVLDCIAGLQEPDSGRIAAGDTVLFESVTGIDLPARRRNIGYLFQTLALFPHMTARQNIG